MSQEKYVVWLDVDDVLVDFCRTYNAHITSMGHGPLMLDYVPVSWNYLEVLGTEERSREIFASLPADWPLNLEAHQGAVAFTWKLHMAGARVVLITSLGQAFAVHRLKNLTAHGIYFDEILFTSKGEGQEKPDYMDALMSRYAGAQHVFADDYWKNLLAVAKEFGSLVSTYTFERPYNAPAAAEMFSLDVDVSKTRQEMFEKILKKVNKGG